MYSASFYVVLNITLVNAHVLQFYFFFTSGQYTSDLIRLE